LTPKDNSPASAQIIVTIHSAAKQKSGGTIIMGARRQRLLFVYA
jgi:hypothetical protein